MVPALVGPSRFNDAMAAVQKGRLPSMRVSASFSGLTSFAATYGINPTYHIQLYFYIFDENVDVDIPFLDWIL